METEIELKFFVSPEFSETLRAKISETKVLQHSSRDLGNTYFDTADKWLRKHDIGLRIRRFDDVFVQTVKTAGRVVAGLHQRPDTMLSTPVMSRTSRFILLISGLLAKMSLRYKRN